MQSQPIALRLPLADGQTLAQLKIGDRVSLTGKLYTARDAAHARLLAAIQAGQPLPVELRGQGIYYCGPCPAPPGKPIGACGPTTADRMDAATPALLQAGVRVLVAKGPRSAAVHQALAQTGGVYVATWGGAGALLARHITACRCVAYPDLGPEAIYELDVCDFPGIVAGDAAGGDLYRTGPAQWQQG